MADFQAQFKKAGATLNEKDAENLMATAQQYALTEIPRQAITEISKDSKKAEELALKLHDIAREDPSAQHVSFYGKVGTLYTIPQFRGSEGRAEAALLNFDAIPVLNKDNLINPFKVKAAEAIKSLLKKPE